MMDRKQFIEQVIEQVRNIPVSSVVSSRISGLIRKGGHEFALCPFHNDRRIGSFVVSDRKKIWKCFSCGVGGDTIKFVSLYDNINYLQAAFRIALEFGLITEEEYNFYSSRRYRRTDIERIQRKYEAIDKEKFKNNIADNETLDQVFRMFIESCSLSEEHLKYLKNVRNLTDEEIKEGLYFTFPTRAIMRGFSKKIREKFGSEEVLSRIPGFYKEESKKVPGTKIFTFARHKGIGIGVKNAFGQVVGIQIRNDKEEENIKGSRYVWFSSSFAMFDDKYEAGTSSGSPVDVVYPEKISNRTVFITEGRFKAHQIAKTTGSVAISVQGVSTWKGILKELEMLPKSPICQERYKNGTFRIHCLLLAFDADTYKYQLAEQIRKMSDQLEENGYYVYYLYWPEEIGKGIDDVLISGNRSDIKRYDKTEWDQAYQQMIKVLLENEPYKNIKDVPDEVLKRYFEEHVRTKVRPLNPNELGKKHRLALAK